MKIGTLCEGVLITIESEDAKLCAITGCLLLPTELLFPSALATMPANFQQNARNKVRKIITQIKINNTLLHAQRLPLNTALQPFSSLSLMPPYEGKKFNQRIIFFLGFAVCFWDYQPSLFAFITFIVREDG